MNGNDRRLLGRLEAHMKTQIKDMDEVKLALNRMMTQMHYNDVSIARLNKGFSNHLQSHKAHERWFLAILVGTLSGLLALVGFVLVG